MPGYGNSLPAPSSHQTDLSTVYLLKRAETLLLANTAKSFLDGERKAGAQGSQRGDGKLGNIVKLEHPRRNGGLARVKNILFSQFDSFLFHEIQHNRQTNLNYVLEPSAIHLVMRPNNGSRS